MQNLIITISVFLLVNSVFHLLYQQRTHNPVQIKTMRINYVDSKHQATIKSTFSQRKDEQQLQKKGVQNQHMRPKQIYVFQNKNNFLKNIQSDSTKSKNLKQTNNVSKLPTKKILEVLSISTVYQNYQQGENQSIKTKHENSLQFQDQFGKQLYGKQNSSDSQYLVIKNSKEQLINIQAQQLNNYNYSKQNRNLKVLTNQKSDSIIEANAEISKIDQQFRVLQKQKIQQFSEKARTNWCAIYDSQMIKGVEFCYIQQKTVVSNSIASETTEHSQASNDLLSQFQPMVLKKMHSQQNASNLSLLSVYERKSNGSKRILQSNLQAKPKRIRTKSWLMKASPSRNSYTEDQIKKIMQRKMKPTQFKILINRVQQMQQN